MIIVDNIGYDFQRYPYTIMYSIYDDDIEYDNETFKYVLGYPFQVELNFLALILY